MTIGRLAIFMLATIALAAAADPISAILDEARGTPAEIFTDVVFHLLDTNQIPEKQRVALLDEVFLRASEAHEAMPERPAILPRRPRPVQDPLQAGQGRVVYSVGPLPRIELPAQLRLDTLSIQSRVVKAMLAIDGKHARELFTRIPRPEMPKPDCKSAILAEPSAYFDALEAVVTHAAFTAKEQEQRVPFWTMEAAVRGIQSSVEIVPAARSLSYLANDQKDALAMTGAFAAALAIEDTDRNFSGALASNVLDAIETAIDRFAKLGVPPQTLQTALRGYLVRHLSGERCEDSATDYAGAVAAFNAAIAGQTALSPISAEESTPSKTEGKADLPKPVDDSTYQKLAKEVEAAVKNPDASADVLARLNAWKGDDGDDPVDVFRRKTGLYFELQGLTRIGLPSGAHAIITHSPLYEAAMPGLIATLSDPDVLARSPGDWLQVVQDLNRRETFYYTGNLPMAVYDPDAAEALVSSGFPALEVYGRMALEESQFDRTVTNYHVEAGSTKDAVLDVANRFELRMGVEWIEGGPKIEARSWVSATPRTILEDIVKASPGYSLDFSDGVVHVFPTKLKDDAADILNLHIGAFQATKEFPPSLVAMALPDRLHGLVVRPDPSKPTAEMAGSVLMSANESTVTFKLENPTVREVLDLLAATGSRHLWIVRYPAFLEKTNRGYLKTLRNGEKTVQEDWKFFPSFDLREWTKPPRALAQ